MKTIFAYEKSEYSRALVNFLNLKLKHKERYENYRRMEELDEIVKNAGDELEVIITTVNTPRPLGTALAMAEKLLEVEEGEDRWKLVKPNKGIITYIGKDKEK